MADANETDVTEPAGMEAVLQTRAAHFTQEVPDGLGPADELDGPEEPETPEAPEASDELEASDAVAPEGASAVAEEPVAAAEEPADVAPDQTERLLVQDLEPKAEPQPYSQPEPAGAPDSDALVAAHADEPGNNSGDQPMFEVLTGPIAPLPVAHTHATQNDQRERQMSRRLVIALACVLIASVAGIGVWYGVTTAQQAAHAAYELAHRTYDVRIPVDAPGYTERATRIPLQVKGTDVDGNAVDQTAYVDGTGVGLQLMQGSYQVSATTSPILADGSLYTVPDTEVDVTIQADEDGDATPQVEGSLQYVAADMSQVTDQEIEAARTVAQADDQSSDRVTSLAQKATELREAAVEDAQRAEVATKFASELFVNVKDSGDTVNSWYGTKLAKLEAVKNYPKGLLDQVDQASKLYGTLKRSYAYASRTEKRGIRDVSVWAPEVEVTSVSGEYVYLTVRCYRASGTTADADYKTSWKKDSVDLTVTVGDSHLVEDYDIANWDEADNS